MADVVRVPVGRAVACALAGVALVAGATACTGDDGSGGAGGEAVGEGDTYEATIRRTTGGVPHITGDTLADVAFGQGWASGEDRACDLADQIVRIRSERARWFGPGDDGENIDSDIAWLAIGIRERATAEWDEASDGVRELLTAFTDGWNAHLAEVGADGLAGWCAGEEWVQPVDPVDLYAYARSVALYASGGAVASFIPSAAPPDGSDDAEDDDGGADGGGDDGGADGGEDDSDESAAADPGAGSGGTGAAPAGAGLPAPVASNGWAIGAERSAEGGGMLVANPHFPWEGALRFWEVHLTVPGELDAYGVQLSGLPGIGIGFTENFGWTHTVSAGNRFTAYTLDLVPGSPTAYRYGDETRDMTSTEHTIEVLGDDGTVEEVTRTTWASHYGPIIDFPGFGWTEDATITYRDGNIDNDEFVEQYLGMLTADDLDEFIEVHEQVNGVPLFNTIATSADGRAWYADTSATPNLSDEALAAYEEALAEDPIVQIAADNGAILLDGSDPRFEWEEVEGARDPGLVPPDDQPQVERDDYVFNANDSFWMPHATEMLEGDHSPLHGRQDTARSPRTRENATVLGDTSADGASGDDGAFTLDELADATVANRGYTSRALLEEVVDRCEGAGTIDVPELPAEDDGDGPPELPAASIDVGPACDVLAGWDGVYDLDRAGPPLWRELMSRYDSADLREAGALWAEPFDPDDPVETPAGLADPPDGGDAGTDPVLVNLGRAVQVLDEAGIAVDATLGEVQFALRAGERIPIHGGDNRDGTTNIVGFGGGAPVLDPELLAQERESLAPDSSLARLDGEVGYPVNNGTSFLLALAFTDDGPQARAFLTYGNTEDRSADAYTEATRRFSDKDWREVAFTDEQIEDQLVDTVTVRG